mmetsp:Transcript_59390/g.165851  ORF Transcript_59390/g.165851 Transcript_59390/m.165851 type:complete len:235 (+) Transcript_59390:33-737(+)
MHAFAPVNGARRQSGNFLVGVSPTNASGDCRHPHRGRTADDRATGTSTPEAAMAIGDKAALFSVVVLPSRAGARAPPLPLLHRLRAADLAAGGGRGCIAVGRSGRAHAAPLRPTRRRKHVLGARVGGAAMPPAARGGRGHRGRCRANSARHGAIQRRHCSSAGIKFRHVQDLFLPGGDGHPRLGRARRISKPPVSFARSARPGGRRHEFGWLAQTYRQTYPELALPCASGRPGG